MKNTTLENIRKNGSLELWKISKILIEMRGSIIGGDKFKNPQEYTRNGITETYKALYLVTDP